jgi:hypothetical protein
VTAGGRAQPDAAHLGAELGLQLRQVLFELRRPRLQRGLALLRDGQCRVALLQLVGGQAGVLVELVLQPLPVGLGLVPERGQCRVVLCSGRSKGPFQRGLLVGQRSLQGVLGSQSLRQHVVVLFVVMLNQILDFAFVRHRAVG